MAHIGTRTNVGILDWLIALEEACIAKYAEILLNGAIDMYKAKGRIEWHRKAYGPIGLSFIDELLEGQEANFELDVKQWKGGTIVRHDDYIIFNAEYSYNDRYTNEKSRRLQIKVWLTD